MRPISATGALWRPMASDSDHEPDLPPDWAEAIAAIGAARRRLLIAGPTDAGKSSFARALLAAGPIHSSAPALLDADPGQKMVGPPGAVTLSASGASVLAALRFVGTTSAAAVHAILGAVEALARRSAGQPLIVNSSGLIRGPGAALLLGTARSAAVDEIVAIGWPPELAALLDRTGLPVRHLRRPAAARRKSQRERARSRRDAFRAHLAGGLVQTWPCSEVAVPSPTVCLALPTARPVCALTDADGVDIGLGVLVGIDGRCLHVFAPPPQRAVGSLRLGAMWACPGPTGWELLDQLVPASNAQPAPPSSN